MPKIRGIKPEFWTDEDIVDLSIPARLLFIGLWNLACDNGHVSDKPKQIKMRLMPADAVNIDKLLDELVENGRITRADGTITVLNFAKHQKPHRRWWTTCDLPLCNVPDDAPTQGYNRGEGSSNTPSQPESNGGATVDHGRTTADVDCEVDVDGELSVREGAKRARALPADFKPNDANRELAAKRGVDINAALEGFIDYHRSKGSTFKDWPAALNTWIRREKPAGPAPTLRSLPHVHELETPPDGLTEAEYSAWMRHQAAKRKAAQA